MSNEMQWYKQREQWRHPVKQYPTNSPEVYQPSELTMEVCDMITDVIMSTKGPYPPFPKKINLQDLANLVEEIWDEND